MSINCVESIQSESNFFFKYTALVRHKHAQGSDLGKAEFRNAIAKVIEFSQQVTPAVVEEKTVNRYFFWATEKSAKSWISQKIAWQTGPSRYCQQFFTNCSSFLLKSVTKLQYALMPNEIEKKHTLEFWSNL